VSPLTLVAAVSMAATSVCSGAEAEVPVRFVGWSADDAAWLEAELARWVTERDRTLCSARTSDEALALEGTGLEARIEFTFKGMRRERSVPKSSDAGLFRYQVAAAAEELARSTWEAPPPPRFGVLARGELDALVAGQWLAGGGVGVTLFLWPSFSVQLFATFSGLQGAPLATGGTVGGFRVGGGLSLSWLPVRPGVFRAGPRASLQVAALSVTVREPDSVGGTGVTPWVQAGGGVTLGVELRHVTLLAFSELGFVIAGAAVELEGARLQRVRGTAGTFGLQAGWLW
jgi:hypothetical protein